MVGSRDPDVFSIPRNLQNFTEQGTPRHIVLSAGCSTGPIGRGGQASVPFDTFQCSDQQRIVISQKPKAHHSAKRLPREEVAKRPGCHSPKDAHGNLDRQVGGKAHRSESRRCVHPELGGCSPPNRPAEFHRCQASNVLDRDGPEGRNAAPTDAGRKRSHETKNTEAVQMSQRKARLLLMRARRHVWSSVICPWPARNLKASPLRLWPAQESEPPRRHPRRQRKPEACSSRAPTRNKRS